MLSYTNGDENQQPRRPRDRIRIDKIHHPTYIALTKPRENENRPDLSPFESMKNVFMLAIFIGYNEEKRIPLGTDKEMIFAWARFSPEEDVPLLRALALSETENVEVLTDQDRILTIAEEYANGGIIEIRKQVEDMPGDRITNLVDLLRNWNPYKALV
jgi:dnd system-associated protein 4